MAQIRIRRNAGTFGKLSGLDVVVGGERLATLREGEQKLLQDLEEGAQIFVEMQGSVRSTKVQLSKQNTELECGTSPWLAIDWLDFCYLPVLREHVFYLRPLTRQP